MIQITNDNILIAFGKVGITFEGVLSSEDGVVVSEDGVEVADDEIGTTLQIVCGEGERGLTLLVERREDRGVLEDWLTDFDRGRGGITGLEVDWI